MAVEKNFGMRLAPAERLQIERLARARETTMKEAIMDAVRLVLTDLEREHAQRDAAPSPTGRLKDAAHLIGSFRSGVHDLSTAKHHMEGYGE